MEEIDDRSVTLETLPLRRGPIVDKPNNLNCVLVPAVPVRGRSLSGMIHVPNQFQTCCNKVTPKKGVLGRKYDVTFPSIGNSN